MLAVLVQGPIFGIQDCNRTVASGGGVISGTTTYCPTPCTNADPNVGDTLPPGENTDSQYGGAFRYSTPDPTHDVNEQANLVVEPPSITKAFSPTQVQVGGTSTLTFTLTNPNTGVALSGVAFTDALPDGLMIPNPVSVTNSCLGGLTTTSGTTITNTISLSGGVIAAGSSCTVTVAGITATTAGVKNNTTGPVSSNEGGTGNTATATLTAVGPPSIAKAFSPTRVSVGGTSTLTFTLTNPAANTVALTGVAFGDTLPSGLVVSTPNGLSNTCGGTVTATAGSGSVSLSGGSIAVSSSCTVKVNVTPTSAGTLTNTSGAVSSTNGGTGNTATAALTAAPVVPPSIAKAFGAATVPLNGTTSLTFTITNPSANTVALTGVAFTDNLPSGLVVATPNGVSSTCGGTATATAGSGSVSLSGGSIAASSHCTISVNVTGTTAGAKNNTTGAVSSTNGGTGNTASASLTVVAPPSIAKAFSPTNNVQAGQASALTFTITNPSPNTGALSGVAFTDTLPSGVVVSTPNGLSNTCGGTVTAVAGSGSVSLSGGSVAASSSCKVVVNVTPTKAGTFNNVSGAVSSTNGGTGNTATATLTAVDSDLALTNVPGNMTVNATSPLGAVVSYTPPTVVDELGETPAVHCVPASGSTFAIGTTTVTCTVTDSDDSNSPVSASFTVTVKSALAQQQDLLAYVRAIPASLGRLMLVRDLNGMINNLQLGNTAQVCSDLTLVGLVAQEWSGSLMSTAQADTILADVNRISAVLACNAGSG